MNISPLNHLKKLFSSISKLSLTLLHIGLPIVLLYLVALLFITLSSPDTPGHVLAHIYTPSLEHITMALTVTVVGAIVADIAERQRNS